MDIDSIINGYPILMSIRKWSLEVGHPVSCIIEMTVILAFLWIIKYIYKNFRWQI
jgi:hypothetical protein